MDILIDMRTGERDRSFRPYIDQEEFKRNVILYDPNGYNIGTGLYGGSQPRCERFVDHSYQFMKNNSVIPTGFINKFGKYQYTR